MSRSEAEYLKSEGIGLVIAKGMAVTYNADPANPIDFFAKWLLRQAQDKAIAAEQEAKQAEVKELREKWAYDQKAAEKAAKAKAQEEEAER